MRSLVLAVALLPALSAAADLTAASRIDAVTVYQSSARVTRAARVEVQPGAARVLLAGLPDALDDDSIRVEGKGSAKARVFGVTVDRVTGAAAATADARVAEEKLERLQDEDRSLDDRAKAAQARSGKTNWFQLAQFLFNVNLAAILGHGQAHSAAGRRMKAVLAQWPCCS